MRYHHEKPDISVSMYGQLYICNHPIYSRCTLFKIGNKGLAVIQQRFVPETKATWWDEIDPWLTDEIYLHPRFKEFFEKFATEPDKDGLYATVTVRQIMWRLKMKPIPREKWETYFDHTPI